jgi:hypothetical protein
MSANSFVTKIWNMCKTVFFSDSYRVATIWQAIWWACNFIFRIHADIFFNCRSVSTYLFFTQTQVHNFSSCPSRHLKYIIRNAVMAAKQHMLRPVWDKVVDRWTCCCCHMNPRWTFGTTREKTWILRAFFVVKWFITCYFITTRMIVTPLATKFSNLHTQALNTERLRGNTKFSVFFLLESYRDYT